MRRWATRSHRPLQAHRGGGAWSEGVNSGTAVSFFEYGVCTLIGVNDSTEDIGCVGHGCCHSGFVDGTGVSFTGKIGDPLAALRMK